MKIAIKTKVVVGFVIMVLLIIAAGVAGYLGLTLAVDEAKEYNSLVREASLAGKLESEILKLNTVVDEFLSGRGDQSTWDFDYRMALARRVVKQAKDESFSHPIKSILDSLDDALDRFQHIFTSLKDLDSWQKETVASDRPGELAIQDLENQIQALHESFHDVEAKISSTLESSREFVRTQREAIDFELQKSFRSTVAVVGATMVIEILISISAAFLFIRIINRPVGLLEQIIKTSPSIAFRFRVVPGWPMGYVSENITQLGYTPNDFYQGKHGFSRIVHPEDLTMVEKTVEDCQGEAGEREVSQEYRVMSGTGEVRWVDERMWVRCDDTGKPAYCEGVLVDVTGRKRAEDALVKEQAARAFVRETFGSYLNEDVVADILECPGGIDLGGELTEITILVSDLRGFTRMTQSLEAPQVVGIINRYLEAMTEIIMRHGGTIDEFTGDGILVFFGAPRHFPDHSRRAVNCAIEMQQAMDGFNRESLKLGHPQLAMGIGIDCGKVIVGNIGSHKRKKYGAVGASINIAFRVEAQTAGGDILVTSAIYDKIGDELLLEDTREAVLKGIAEPVTLYKIAGIKTPVQTAGRT